MSGVHKAKPSYKQTKSKEQKEGQRKNGVTNV
jgi:hypothetical protein